MIKYDFETVTAEEKYERLGDSQIFTEPGMPEETKERAAAAWEGMPDAAKTALLSNGINIYATYSYENEYLGGYAASGSIHSRGDVIFKEPDVSFCVCLDDGITPLKSTILHEAGHQIDRSVFRIYGFDEKETPPPGDSFPSPSAEPEFKALFDRYSEAVMTIDGTAKRNAARTPGEMFAEAFRLHIENPEALKTAAPEVFEYMDRINSRLQEIAKNMHPKPYIHKQKNLWDVSKEDREAVFDMAKLVSGLQKGEIQDNEITQRLEKIADGLSQNVSQSRMAQHLWRFAVEYTESRDLNDPVRELQSYGVFMCMARQFTYPHEFERKPEKISLQLMESEGIFKENLLDAASGRSVPGITDSALNFLNLSIKNRDVIVAQNPVEMAALTDISVGSINMCFAVKEDGEIKPVIMQNAAGFVAACLSDVEITEWRKDLINDAYKMLEKTTGKQERYADGVFVGEGALEGLRDKRSEERKEDSWKKIQAALLKAKAAPQKNGAEHTESQFYKTAGNAEPLRSDETDTKSALLFENPSSADTHEMRTFSLKLEFEKPEPPSADLEEER